MFKYLLLFMYISVSIILLVFNWDIFTTVLDFDTGFGFIKVMPFIVLQLFGGLILIVFALVDGVKDLQREIKITHLEKQVLGLKKDIEISILKNTQRMEPQRMLRTTIEKDINQ